MIDLKQCSLGIELGSTRIKAVLVGDTCKPVAQGDFTWENRLENSRKLADLKAFYQVKESYINTVFDVIEKENGGIERFLRKKLYLTPKASEELKKKYLI